MELTKQIVEFKVCDPANEEKFLALVDGVASKISTLKKARHDKSLNDQERIFLNKIAPTIFEMSLIFKERTSKYKEYLKIKEQSLDLSTVHTMLTTMSEKSGVPYSELLNQLHQMH